MRSRKNWLCRIGWHTWSWYRACTWIKGADGFHREAWRLVATCDRWECTATKRTNNIRME